MDTSSFEELYPYHIVEFIHPGKKPKVRNVDVVATKWIIVDDKKKKLFVRYPPPPYTSETHDNLDVALETLLDAPCSWQTYTIQLKGKARNFKEAFEKLDLLKDQETAYTMNSNDSCSDVEKKAVEVVRQSRLKKMASSFKSLVSESPAADEIKQKGQLQHSPSLSEMYKPSTTIKTYKCNHLLNKMEHPLNEITNTKAKSKENICASTKQTKGLQEQSMTLAYANKQTATGNPLMSNGTSPSKEEGPSTLIQKVSVSSTPKKTLVDASAASTQHLEKGFHPPYNTDRQGGFEETSTKTHDVLPKDSDSAQKNVKVSLYQMLFDQLKHIRTDISEIKNDVNKMKIDIETLKNALSKSNVIGSKDFVGTIQQLCNKFKFKIPFETVDEFDDFNIELQQNVPLYEAVSTVLQTGLDSSLVMSRSIVNMLKLFLTKEVAGKYVAVKRKKDKKVMKNTPFFNCIEGLIKERRLIYNMDTTDKDMISALSAVLSNSGSWYTSKKSDTSNPLRKRHRKTSRKDKPSNENDDYEDLSETNEKLHKSDEISPKCKVSDRMDNSESSDDESLRDDNDDEPAFKVPRFTFQNISNIELTSDRNVQLSPVIEVEQSLLEENNGFINLDELNHVETQLQVVEKNGDPLMSTVCIKPFKGLSYEEEFDENYLFNFNK